MLGLTHSLSELLLQLLLLHFPKTCENMRQGLASMSLQIPALDWFERTEQDGEFVLGGITEESDGRLGYNILPCPAMAKLKVLFDL